MSNSCEPHGTALLLFRVALLPEPLSRESFFMRRLWGGSQSPGNPEGNSLRPGEVKYTLPVWPPEPSPVQPSAQLQNQLANPGEKHQGERKQEGPGW